MRFRPAVIGMNDLPMCYFYEREKPMEFSSSREASECINDHYRDIESLPEYDCVVLSEDEFFEDTSR